VTPLDPERALGAILPAGAVAAEICEDGTEGLLAGLYEEERLAIDGASERRQREFAAGRACARHALALLGLPPVAMPVAETGAPVWPDGIVGSITHKGAYRAAAVAFAGDLSGLGIDAELDAPLPAGVLERIASPAEIETVKSLLREKPGTPWDRLLFSAKEATIKTCRGLGLTLAGVREVAVRFDTSGSTFAAFAGAEGLPITGAWTARLGLLVTAANS
jgi:4'-phosphopantetheinyl transferase EntD